MELLCISTFSVTRQGVRTVYPAYPERVLCLRQNNKILANNLFNIHRTGAHVIELSTYDAIGTVLMQINDTEQYKKILEKLYIRLLIHGASFDYQPRHGCEYDTTLIMSTFAPENVIVLAISKILASMNPVASEVDAESVAGMSVMGSMYQAAPPATYVIPASMAASQTHVEVSLTSIKESLYNMNNILQSLDSRMYTVEDRCDALDGHIGALGEYNKPIKPPSFCGQSDTDSSVHTEPLPPIYSGRYTSNYTPQTNLQYSGVYTRPIITPSTYSAHDNVVLSSTQSSVMSSVSSAHTLHTRDDILASVQTPPPSPPPSYYDLPAVAAPAAIEPAVVAIEPAVVAPVDIVPVVDVVAIESIVDVVAIEPVVDVVAIEPVAIEPVVDVIAHISG